MAQISNFSENSSVQVFGTRAGTDVHFLLGPGRQTADDMDCKAVRGGDGVTIFDEDRWWKVLTDEVFVYDYEDSMFDDWFVSDLSLHCIPFKSASGAPPWDRGYELVDDSSVTEPLDQDVTFDRTPAHIPDDFAEREIDSSSYLFGRFVRTKQFISVRLDGLRVGGLGDDAMRAEIPRWKSAIERAWNDGSVLPPFGSTIRLIFECDWLNTTDGSSDTAAGHAEDHYTVLIGPNKERASMFSWNIKTLDETARHEFGHYLGLDDGYTRDGELPWLRRAITSGAIPLASGAIRDVMTGIKPLLPWYTFQSAWNKGRVEERVRNAKVADQTTVCCGSAPNMMETRRSSLITRCLIDTINNTVHELQKEHETQPLCWQEHLYRKYLPRP